jgi:hypothetical protein
MTRPAAGLQDRDRPQQYAELAGGKYAAAAGLAGGLGEDWPGPGPGKGTTQ